MHLPMASSGYVVAMQYIPLGILCLGIIMSALSNFGPKVLKIQGSKTISIASRLSMWNDETAILKPRCDFWAGSG